MERTLSEGMSRVKFNYLRHHNSICERGQGDLIIHVVASGATGTKNMLTLLFNLERPT